MAKEHERFLSQLFISEASVYTGGEIVDLLCEKFPNCSRENARKVIEFAVRNDVMKSSKPITFGHNQYAYYSNYSQLTTETVQNLMEKNRPGLYRVINRIRTNDVISYYEILKLAAVPTTKNKSKVTSLKQIINIIEELKIATPMTNWGSRYLVSSFLSESEQSAILAMKEKHEEIQLDAVFIPMFIGWLKKHNIMTTNKVLYRSKTNPHNGVVHNDLVWDAIAYTNTTGYSEIIGNDEENATCIVLDVKISSPYQVDDLMGFYDRIQMYRNSVGKNNKKRKILPIIVANDADFGVRSQIGKLKMLYFNLGTVFGERIYEVIRSLQLLTPNNLMTLGNEHKITLHVENSLKALKEAGQEDNLGNLKGELFERLMFSVFHTIFFGHDIIHSYKFSRTSVDGKKENYEYDYLIETKDEIIAIELKGYKGANYIRKGEFIKEKGRPDQHTVKWFFNWTYPKLKEKFKDNPKGKPIRCCYITTAQFHEDALVILEKINLGSDKPKNIDVFYDGNKLIELLKRYELHNEIKVIKQYYKPITSENSKDYRTVGSDFIDSTYEAEIIEIDNIEDLEEFLKC